jgi:large subunit ribosomal protein L25
MEEFTLKAEPRQEFGTRAARRLRSAGRLPANIYGHREENVAVTLDLKEFLQLFEAGHRVVTVQVNGKPEPSVVKEVQYDWLGSTLLHVDFTRISKDERFRMAVPVVIIGVPKGLSAGGVLDFPLKDLHVEALPDDMPERIELNIEELKLGETLRVKDLKPPEKCVFVDDPELVVIAVSAPRAELPPEAAAPAASEPELIGRKREEGEEEAAEKEKK